MLLHEEPLHALIPVLPGDIHTLPLKICVPLSQAFQGPPDLTKVNKHVC